jgi:hypothetical protein
MLLFNPCKPVRGRPTSSSASWRCVVGSRLARTPTNERLALACTLPCIGMCARGDPTGLALLRQIRSAKTYVICFASQVLVLSPCVIPCRVLYLPPCPQHHWARTRERHSIIGGRGNPSNKALMTVLSGREQIDCAKVHRHDYSQPLDHQKLLVTLHYVT